MYGYFYLQQFYHATACISAIDCIIHQGQLRSSMKEDKQKDVGYFHEYYLRCQGMVDYVTSLVDSVSLLCQSTEPLIDGMHVYVCSTDNVRCFNCGHSVLSATLMQMLCESQSKIIKRVLPLQKKPRVY